MLKTYFAKFVLPELMAKYYTRPALTTTANELLFCYCRTKEDSGLEVECRSASCFYRKFHLKCCGLKKMPVASKVWYCKHCRKVNHKRK